MAANYRKLISTLCAAFDVRPQTRFNKLPNDLRRIILYGSRPEDMKKRGIEFEGVIPNLQRRQRASGNGNSRGRLGRVPVRARLRAVSRSAAATRGARRPHRPRRRASWLR